MNTNQVKKFFGLGLPILRILSPTANECMHLDYRSVTSLPFVTMETSSELSYVAWISENDAVVNNTSN